MDYEVAPQSGISLRCDFGGVIIMPSKDKFYNGRKGIDLDTLSSVKRPKPSDVMRKKKGSSNTVKADLSSVNHSNLNKNVKRYYRKDLLSCNNSHLVDTKSEYDCNAAMHADCNSYDVVVNDLFVFDDVSNRKSQVRKMPFRKKPSASLNIPSRNNSKKSLSRNVLKWLPKLQPLAEPIPKWIPRVIRCSKHMTGNRALLTNFVEKFLGTVHFGNNDFVVIVGYGDVIIGSMTIKKVYYVEAIVTACFTQNRSIIHKHFNKTSYELSNKRKPNIKFFHVFGCRCYLLNDYDDVGKLKAKGDIRVFVGYAKDSAAFRFYNKRTHKIHESVNVNFDEISEMASKQFSL
nr:retrovirus-related Pol polyprotein from transposon TNT 1-94 [Tanacetum cinerariifolium]